MFAARTTLVVSLALALALAACGPGIKIDEDGGGNNQTPDAAVSQPDAYFGPTGSITGTVWAPGNAPGMVPAGHEIPVASALVYLAFNRPADIPPNVYCDPCSDPPSGTVMTDTKGNFAFPMVVPGTYWLVIEKAQFRLEQEILVSPDENIVLPATATTLPSRMDTANGMWIPRMALADGLWDQMEDIMGKLAMGQNDSGNNFVCSSAAGVWDLYLNGSADCTSSSSVGDLNSLIGDIDRMRQYHIIFVPCSNGDNSQLFGNATYRENIRQYVQEGGKFYVTDWSAEWEDAPYPEFIVFQSDIDTTSKNGPFGDGDGFPGYESAHARANNMQLRDWLHGQQGPLVTLGGYSNGTIDADDFVVEGNYDHIESLANIQIGSDNEGLPIYEQPDGWVIGDWGDGGSTDHPLTVTFEPQGCGRVLYSTYHTADNAHSGLVPQERVLVYLIMEIGVCKSGPIVQ